MPDDARVMQAVREGDVPAVKAFLDSNGSNSASSLKDEVRTFCVSRCLRTCLAACLRIRAQKMNVAAVADRAAALCPGSK